MNEHELDSYTAELMILIYKDVEDGLWTNVQRDGFDPRNGCLEVDGFVNLRRIAEVLAQQGWTLP